MSQINRQHRDDDHPEISARNARYGLWLFAVYLALYAGFMGLSAFEPQLMSKTPFGGVNLAIIYGFGLIVAALVLAVIYMVLCRTRE
ncbi:MAG TPA: DUF485 domain-containing protein [Tepidisphaeraceae bacterium]|jgi:uncharacterized membrane protein (DUF485 family)|nr:DUF485 domain-containing protein [Tepidisphaeraceae bacterium]